MKLYTCFSLKHIKPVNYNFSWHILLQSSSCLTSNMNTGTLHLFWALHTHTDVGVVLFLILLAFAAGYNHLFLLGLTCLDRTEGINAHTWHERIRKPVECNPIFLACTVLWEKSEYWVSPLKTFEGVWRYYLDNSTWIQEKKGKSVGAIAQALCIACTRIWNVLKKGYYTTKQINNSSWWKKHRENYEENTPDSQSQYKQPP